MGSKLLKLQHNLFSRFRHCSRKYLTTSVFLHRNSVIMCYEYEAAQLKSSTSVTVSGSTSRLSTGSSNGLSYGSCSCISSRCFSSKSSHNNNHQEIHRVKSQWKRLLIARKAVAQNFEIRAKTAKSKILKRTAEFRENILTVPNGLCVLRIALAPVVGYLVVGEHYKSALATFIVAGITDLLDGQIARRYPSQQSLLGSALDPLADKLLVGVLFLSLTYTGLIPLPLTVLVVARDVGLVGTAFYVRYKTLPPPFTIFRYFDLTTVSAKVKPTLISKANTAIQLVFVATTLAAPVFNYNDSMALHALGLLTGGTTIWSGLSYLYSSNAFELIRKTRTKPRLPKYYQSRHKNQNSNRRVYK